MDIRLFLSIPLPPNSEIGSRTARRTGLFFDDLDRDFRAVGLRKPGLVFQTGGNGAVADLVRAPESVEFEQFRRKRFAAGVPLTFVLVDVNSQLARHSGDLLPLR